MYQLKIDFEYTFEETMQLNGCMSHGEQTAEYCFDAVITVVGQATLTCPETRETVGDTNETLLTKTYRIPDLDKVSVLDLEYETFAATKEKEFQTNIKLTAAQNQELEKYLIDRVIFKTDIRKWKRN